MSEHAVTTPSLLKNISLLYRAHATHFFLRFSTKDQILFAKRLAFLIEAQVPLVEALAIIRDQSHPRTLPLYNTILEDISAGKYLSASLGRHPHLFGAFTIAIIRIGEHSGTLGPSLVYLAEELEKAHALRSKVKSALIYPLFIVSATVIVISLLTVFIFPKIMPIFISLNVTLPLTTRALLSISSYLQHWGFATLLVFGAFLVLVQSLRRLHEPTHRASDALILHLPIIGPLTRTYNGTHFCRTLGLLLKSGLQLSTALVIVAETTTNLVYKNIFIKISKRVTLGEELAPNIETYHSLFPDMIPKLVAVGEKTGNLSETLEYLARFYESEVDAKTKNLSSVLEPALLLGMGLAIGIVAISVITPIYEVTKNLHY